MPNDGFVDFLRGVDWVSAATAACVLVGVVSVLWIVAEIVGAVGREAP
jgi:hypothetical protein